MRIRMFSWVLAFLLAAALSSACAALPESTQPAPGAPIITPGALTLTDVRGRPGPLAGGTGAVYLTILNGLDRDVRFISASSPVASAVETHETVNDNGVMRMNPQPDGFLIPAQQSVKLEPGGKHIMLIGLAAPLAVGDEYPLALVFDTGEVMSITVPVMELVPGMEMGAETENAGETVGEDEHPDDSAQQDAHQHDDSQAQTSGKYPAEIQAAVAALPVYEIHGLDDSLMAGVLDPGAIGLVDEFLAGLETVTWPAELHEPIDNLTALGEELRAALEAGDLTRAAELVRQIHDQAHELEFQVQQ